MNKSWSNARSHPDQQKLPTCPLHVDSCCVQAFSSSTSETMKLCPWSQGRFLLPRHPPAMLPLPREGSMGCEAPGKVRRRTRFLWSHMCCLEAFFFKLYPVRKSALVYDRGAQHMWAPCFSVWHLRGNRNCNLNPMNSCRDSCILLLRKSSVLYYLQYCTKFILTHFDAKIDRYVSVHILGKCYTKV